MTRKDLMTQEYFGGLRIGPEVRRLREHFGDMSSRRGTTIAHKDIEQLIGVAHTESRYKTITAAWRRNVRKETGIEIRCDLPEVVGVGFRVLSDSEQVSYSMDLRRRGGKRLQHLIDQGL